MPLYEYKCHKCGQEFEVLQKFSDAPLAVHAECGGVVERLLSAPAFQFKGSGFYITDYARKNGSSNGHSSKTDPTSSKTETAAAKPAEKKSSSSSDTTAKS